MVFADATLHPKSDDTLISTDPELYPLPKLNMDILKWLQNTCIDFVKTRVCMGEFW